MKYIKLHIIFYTVLFSFSAKAQDLAYNDPVLPSYEKAYDLAFEGKNKVANEVLLEVLKKQPEDLKSKALLAQTYSWQGFYNAARKEFNEITSVDKKNLAVWVSAIKNELYAKNWATANGLANKAMNYLGTHDEIVRLKKMALNQIESTSYDQKGWFNVTSTIPLRKTNKNEIINKEASAIKDIKEEAKKPEVKKELNNRIAFRNSGTVFDQRNQPMFFSTIEYKRQTLAGSILPRINYANRNGQSGVQYDIDFYPKFSKRFYAYLNYGFSNSTLYPKQKVGGDLYANLPGAMEFSAGARHITLQDRNVTVITNSIGHYRGNYYFSLRSSITPKSDNLTRVSGNLLVRKYLKDAHNFFGLNVGMGYSPEIRQLISGDELLAETLLFIESQRMSLQYQFTAKKSPNVYSASLGVSRQEKSFESGSFIWAFSAGFAYQIKF